MLLSNCGSDCHWLWGPGFQAASTPSSPQWYYPHSTSHFQAPFLQILPDLNWLHYWQGTTYLHACIFTGVTPKSQAASPFHNICTVWVLRQWKSPGCQNTTVNIWYVCTRLKKKKSWFGPWSRVIIPILKEPTAVLHWHGSGKILLMASMSGSSYAMTYGCQKLALWGKMTNFWRENSTQNTELFYSVWTNWPQCARSSGQAPVQPPAMLVPALLTPLLDTEK